MARLWLHRETKASVQTLPLVPPSLTAPSSVGTGLAFQKSFESNVAPFVNSARDPDCSVRSWQSGVEARDGSGAPEAPSVKPDRKLEASRAQGSGALHPTVIAAAAALVSAARREPRGAERRGFELMLAFKRKEAKPDHCLGTWAETCGWSAPSFRRLCSRPYSWPSFSAARGFGDLHLELRSKVWPAEQLWGTYDGDQLRQFVPPEPQSKPG